MDITVLRYGYEMKDKTDEFGEYTPYHFAEPVEYADGASLGDCWIVDARGQGHPGIDHSPVPVMACDLKHGRPISGAGT